MHVLVSSLPGGETRQRLAIAALLAIAVLLFDWGTPLGYAEWFFFILVPVAMPPRRWYPTLAGVLCVPLIFAGYYLSPSGVPEVMGQLNRVVGSMVVLAVVVLLEIRLRAEERVAALAAASMLLGRSLDTHETLDQLLDCLAVVAPYDSANVMLLEDDSHFVIAVHRGYENWPDGELLCSTRFSVREHPTLAEIQRTGRALIVRDTRTQSGWRSHAGTSHILSWMGVPLISRGRLLGIYSLDKATAGFFEPRHLGLAESLAAHAALAIERAQTYESLQRQAEDLQRQVMERERAEGRLRKFFRQASDSIYVLDANNRFLDVNEAASRLTGYSREELLTMRVEDLVEPSQRARVEPEASEMRAGNPHLGEWLTRRKDGSTALVEVSAQRLDDESFLAIARDITARRATEDRLATSEQRLRLASQAAHIGLWDWDIPANDVFLSPEWKAQLGYLDHEVPNSFDAWRDRLHPDDRNATLAKVNAYIADPQAMYEMEFRLKHKDGSWRWIHSQAGAHRDGEGKPLRLIGCHVDITQRKEAEANLRESNAELRRLNERLELVREQEQSRIAREIHDVLGQLLTSVRLDLFQLRALLGVAQPKVSEQLATLEQLTGDILWEMRRISSDLHPAILTDLGLLAAFEWHCRQFEKRSATRLVMDLPPEEPALSLATKTVLFRILQESLTNVARHAGASKVEVGLHTSAAAGRRMLELKVADNGSGINLAYSRTGHLGLVSMRERAAAVQGEVSVETSSAGTTITARVPLEEASCASA